MEVNLHKPKKFKTTGMGYKTFFADRKSGCIQSLFHTTGKTIPVGKWVNEKDYRCCADEELIHFGHCGYDMYQTGWHIWATLRAARSRKMFDFEEIHKVKYRRVVQTGVEYHGNVDNPGPYYHLVVAKEMFVFPRVVKHKGDR
jgi:hypothetical protein